MGIIRRSAGTQESDTCLYPTASSLTDDYQDFRSFDVANHIVETKQYGELNNIVDDWFHSDPTILFQVMLEAIELIGIGWLVCDVTGRVLRTNPRAAAILRARDGLELDASGALTAPHGCSESLDEGLQQAARAPLPILGGKSDIGLAVHRVGSKPCLRLLVRSIQWNPATDSSRRIITLVLILDPPLPTKPTNNDVHQLYRFTAVEARLATLIMDGKPLRVCCHELGVCRSRVYAILKRIFIKTRVHSQNELISLLFRSIGSIVEYDRSASQIAAQVAFAKPPGQ
jgi:DNA-binding CsgD family transcriptional regulator